MMTSLPSNENRSTVATCFKTSSQRNGNISQERLRPILTCDAIQSHIDRLKSFGDMWAFRKKALQVQNDCLVCVKKVVFSVKQARLHVEWPSFRFVAKQSYSGIVRPLQSAPSRDRRTSERRKEELQKVSCVSGVPRMLDFFYAIKPLVD